MTYLESFQWMQRHESVMDTAVQLLQTYPHLLSEKPLSQWQLFLKQFRTPAAANGANNTASRSPTNFEVKQIPARSKKPKGSSELVYVCGYAAPDDDRSAMRAIIPSLTWYCYVHCHPQVVIQQEDEGFLSCLMREAAAIQEAKLFLLVLNRQTLCNDICMAILHVAAECGVKIMSVKEDGCCFDVDEMELSFIKDIDEALKNAATMNSSQTGTPTMRIISVFQGMSDKNSDSSKESKGSKQRPGSLERLLRNQCQSACSYNADNHRHCLKEILHKISKVAGFTSLQTVDAFPYIEPTTRLQRIHLEEGTKRDQAISPSFTPVPTRYVVYKGKAGGKKVSPVVVNFPADHGDNDLDSPEHTSDTFSSPISTPVQNLEIAGLASELSSSGRFSPLRLQ